MSDQLWNNAANAIAKAGKIPIPVTDTILELVKNLMNEEQAEFIQIFTKPSLNIDEMREASDLDEKDLDNMLESLMRDGLIIGTTSKSKNIMVYRLMSFFPGIFEFSLMKGETGEKQVNISKLFDKLFDELSDIVQQNYDDVVGLFKTAPPLTRVAPIEEEARQDKEAVLPFEDVKKIIERFDTIAVTHCYCRHEKDLLNDSCKVTKERENCLVFGKIAKFTIDYNFAKPISKEDALKILRKSEEEGLVHKAFHVHQDVNREEEAICNCCKCCCGTSQLYYRGGFPMHTFTSYIAKIKEDDCIGCEVCVEKCPMEAIEMKDGIAVLDESKCFGCGLCAYHCSEDAAILERTGKREVFVPPPKLKK